MNTLSQDQRLTRAERHERRRKAIIYFGIPYCIGVGYVLTSVIVGLLR